MSETHYADEEVENLGENYAGDGIDVPVRDRDGQIFQEIKQIIAACVKMIKEMNAADWGFSTSTQNSP